MYLFTVVTILFVCTSVCAHSANKLKQFWCANIVSVYFIEQPTLKMASKIDVFTAESEFPLVFITQDRHAQMFFIHHRHAGRFTAPAMSLL